MSGEIIKKKISFESLSVFLIGYVAVTRVWLAFSKLEYIAAFYYINQAVNFICVFFGFILIIKSTDKAVFTAEKLWLIILPLFYVFFSVFCMPDNSNVIPAVFSLLTCFVFIMLSKKQRLDVFEVFYKIILYTSLISLFFYLCYILNINIGYSVVPYYEPNQPNARYVKWLIFAVFRSRSEIRLCGIFNEPGSFGTVCSFLFITKYNNSAFWEKAILLMSIFLSFSVAGYLLVFLFVMLRFIKKDPGYYILVIIMAVSYLAVTNMDFKNENIDRLVSRFSITEEGIKGNNRTTLAFDNAFSDFIVSPQKWFGAGKNYTYNFSGILSYKQYVFQFGIVGFGMWLMHWVYCGLKYAKKNADCIIWLILFVVSIYQRPAVITGLYGFTVLFGGMEYIKQSEKLKEKKYAQDKDNAAHTRLLDGRS